VARLAERLAEATAALATLDDLTGRIGEAVASHLADHTVVLRRWLDALQRRAAAE
jgi:hypothetical protein